MADAFTYFITALVLTSNSPKMGWLQYTHPYDDLKLCQEYIKINKDGMILSISKHFKGKFVEVKGFECMTRENAVDLNAELGH